MRYFLTGATGFIGGHIARQLRAEGHEVAALVRSPEKARSLAELGVELHPGDITDPASMRGPMEGADGVFHIAAWYQVGARDSAPATAINVEGTRHVLTLMRELGIPKGVYTSTLAVFSDTRGALVDEGYRFDGRHLSVYDRTKWQAHYDVAQPMMAEGLPLVVVQPGVVYGPGDHSAIRDLLIQYLKGQLPALPEQTAFCWAHVEDVARAHLLAMAHGRPGESYIVAGEPHTLSAAFALAERLTGKPAPKLAVPPGLLKAAARLSGVLEHMVPLPEAYTAEGLRVSAGTTYLGSNAKARRELGYDPRPLEVGLAETLAHERKLLGI